MKKQLNEASDYHHQKVTELDQREKCEVSGLLKIIQNKQYNKVISLRIFHKPLVKNH